MKKTTVFITVLLTLVFFLPASYAQASEATPPAAPTNLIATAVSLTQIDLSWTASTDDVGVSGYNIYRCTGSACTPTTQIATSDATSYSDTGLMPDTTYAYAVSAFDAAGNESAKSSLATAISFAQTGNTYYISPAGSDATGNGTSANPWATLSKAFSQMKGGDTLIFKNGIYTGNLNRITTSNYPPYGSGIQYTTIKAENDGSVIIDGQDSTFMFYFHPSNVTNAYWKFEGIIWARSSGNGVYLGNTAYVKFLRCGVFDAASGNNGGFVIGRGATYILLEDCYAWGSGRYKFLLYHGNRIILRRCVARFDKADAGGNVIAAFSIYASDRVEVQNGISIDGDNPGFWLNVGEYGGSFLIPSTDGPSTNINIVGSIALNVAMQFGNLTKNLDNITIKNSVGYHLREGVWARDSANYNHVTIGDLYGPSLQVPNVGLQYYPGDDPINSINIRNSILYKIKGTALTSFALEDYNVLYGNNLNYNNTSAGKNTITNSNPNLKYLTRIESDNSLLHNKASDGGDIGANILYRYGVSGTLWGEPGYDQLTNEQLWPFPNEDIIKAHMASYEGPPSGKRGFAADGNDQFSKPLTLTRYIWQYLGNQIPCEIYNECSLPSLKGDVNNDSFVDVLDVQALVNHILGLQDYGANVDVNKDGSVDVLDIQEVVNVILG